MRRRLVEDDCDARREALQEVLESCELHTKTPPNTNTSCL